MRKYELRQDELTVDNIEQFAKQLQLLLAGKLYTFISVNETFGQQPRIRVNQYLDGRSTKPHGRETFPKGAADNISVASEKTWAQVSLCDTYGVACISLGSYFEFHEEGRYEPERVEIEFKAGGGNNIVWVIYPTGDLVNSKDVA